MLADLQRLTQANMADEIDRFVTALDGDLSSPKTSRPGAGALPQL